jgi:hypothetical protein
VAQIPQLSEKQIHDVLVAKLSEFLGADGEWVVSRRTEDDTDTIFQDTLTDSIAVALSIALAHAKHMLITGEAAEPAQHVAPRAPEAGDVAEPSVVTEPEALGWQPAPITVWTDLRKPVTGEIPRVGAKERRLVA